jgi:two-component system, NarL family, sensor kinase
MTWLKSKLRQPTVQFSVAGLLALAVVGGVAALLISKAGKDEAIRDAKRVTTLSGQGIVGPALTPALLRGDPAALRRMDAIVRQHILGQDGIERVKVWTADSRIVYSDEPRLIGRTFPLGADDLAVLEAGGGVEAGPSDLSSPENQYEDQSQDLVEVYLGLRATDGTPLLYETYIKSSFITSSGQEVFSALAPVIIGAVLLLAALQLPLAASLAKRLRRGQRDREALLERSINASEIERRRIAQDLHDSVVQDLAGVSYSMAAAAERAGGRGHQEEAGELREAGAQTRQSIRALRALLVELYPPDLQRSGLKAALSDLVTGVEARGIGTELDVPEALELPAETEALLFRAAQETLRNIVAHAQATRAELRVHESERAVTLEVSDDGIGYTPTEMSTPNGHFGLRTIGDLARDAGGTLELDSAPGAGTRVRIELPLR